MERGGVAEVSDDDALTPDEVASFLDGRLSGQELARVEAYLADNPSARHEIIEAARIITTAPKRELKRSRGAYPLVALAAAAAIAIVLIQPRDALRGGATVPTERRGIADEPVRIELVSPSDGEDVSESGRPFKWRSVEAATYRLVVSDSSGRTIYQASTSDTSLILPQSLKKPGTYYWSVDALATDGASATSGAHEFVVTGR